MHPCDIEVVEVVKVDKDRESVGITFTCKGWNTLSDYKKTASFDDRKMLEAFQNEFRTFQNIKVQNISKLLNIELSSFTDESGANKDFRDEGGKLSIGPPGKQRSYYQPKGWVRYGLKVTGKYKNDRGEVDDTWITPFQHANNWYRAFHSTHQEVFRPVVDGGLRASGGGCKLGAGVYVSPFIEYAGGPYSKYKSEITIPLDDGTEKKVNCAFQCAVKSIQKSDFKMPGGERFGYDPSDHAEWLVEDASHVRPYGILIRDGSPPSKVANRSSNMMMRMFHPVNGRMNFEEMGLVISRKCSLEAPSESCFSPMDSIHSNCVVPVLPTDFSKPPPRIMSAMLALEERLRLSPETQALYADPSIDSIAVTTDIQVQVVREFGYPDSFVQLIRAAAKLYKREELPFESLPHYVRFNRSRKGSLSVGAEVPNIPLCFVRNQGSCLEEWKVERSFLLDGDEASTLTTVIAAGSFT
jgi:hypothetical protein